MGSSDESEDETLSTEIFEDICDSSMSNPSVYRTEAGYKIRDLIKQRQMG